MAPNGTNLLEQREQGNWPPATGADFCWQERCFSFLLCSIRKLVYTFVSTQTRNRRDVKVRLLDVIEPRHFVQWAQTALDHLEEKNVARILECSRDEGLQMMAASLEDPAIECSQVLAVLVAIDLYFEDIVTKRGVVIDFSKGASRV